MFDAEGELSAVVAADLSKLAVIDVIVLCAILMCERSLKIMNTKLIQYDRPELCKPQNKEQLIADLEERTGLKIKKVEVGGFDFLKDSVVLRVTYEGKFKGNEVDSQFKVRKSQWRNV
jgi:O-succinylbenzoate synthase